MGNFFVREGLLVPIIQGDFFTGDPPKSAEKLIWARLGVSRPIYVNVDSPNLELVRGGPVKKITL